MKKVTYLQADDMVAAMFGRTSKSFTKCETLEYPNEMADDEICESMFSKFNADNRPDGQIRRSMCVGDRLEITEELGKVTVYQCANIGWNVVE